MPFHSIKISHTIAGLPRYHQFITSVYLCSLKHTGENSFFKLFIFETFDTAKSTIFCEIVSKAPDNLLGMYVHSGVRFYFFIFL
jgi:hypothetical protein